MTGLSVRVPDEQAFAATLDGLVSERVASRIAARDASLWGPDAAPEAARRLAWVGVSTSSRPLVAEIDALREELQARGLTRVVLCGMGGSSLAPEVICGAAGLDIDIVDSSAPDFVRRATGTRLSETVVVVSSKSGSTVETDSQKRAFEAAFASADIDPAERIVVVTDPGSPFDEAATEAGYRVFRADPDVGGRYSALTAFGLVPSGLAGADIAGLLDEAESVRAALETDDDDNPGLRLGALLGQAAKEAVDKLVLLDAGASYSGLGDWVEQLVAESTGKQGKGILPVVAEDGSTLTADAVLATYGPEQPGTRVPSSYAVSVDLPLGAQFLLWEYATAVAGRVIGINPFDQPDVESAKAAAREMLDGGAEVPAPLFTDGAVSVHANPGWIAEGTRTVAAAVEALLDQVDGEDGYLAVQAYLDRHRDADLARARARLAERIDRPVTWGWGPRFLHSTGQYHKGGPPTGAYLQLTGVPQEDLEVPGRPFSFQEFLIAQAVGDAAVLAEKGRPVLRLHLEDLDAGLTQVREVLGL